MHRSKQALILTDRDVRDRAVARLSKHVPLSVAGYDCTTEMVLDVLINLTMLHSYNSGFIEPIRPPQQYDSGLAGPVLTTTMAHRKALFLVRSLPEGGRTLNLHYLNNKSNIVKLKPP